MKRIIKYLLILVFIQSLLSSCEADDVDHRKCKPGCEGKWINDSTSTHDYKDPYDQTNW